MFTVRVLITGFGAPQLDKKKEILTNNLTRFREALNRACFRIHIFVYDRSVDLSEVCAAFPELWISLHYQEGYPGNFVFRTDPSTVREDRVMMLLDDVEILFPIDEFIIECEDTSHYDKRSEEDDRDEFLHATCLTSDSHLNATRDHMIQGYDNDRKEPTVVVARNVEYFVYYMTSRAFAKYHTLFDEQTRTMWGIDYTVTAILTCVLHYRFPVRHYFGGSMNSDKHEDPIGEFLRVVSRIGLEDLFESVCRVLSHERDTIDTIIRWLSHSTKVLEFMGTRDHDLVVYGEALRRVRNKDEPAPVEIHINTWYRPTYYVMIDWFRSSGVRLEVSDDPSFSCDTVIVDASHLKDMSVVLCDISNRGVDRIIVVRLDDDVASPENYNVVEKKQHALLLVRDK